MKSTTAKKILKEIAQLSRDERIWVLQEVLKSMQDVEQRTVMTAAAEELAEEYRTNKELTAFTDIDFENFYEPR